MNRSGRVFLFLPVMVFLIQCASPSTADIIQEPVSQPPQTQKDIEDPPVDIDVEDIELVDLESPLIILDAILQAYPDRVKSLELRNGDWSLLIGGEPFYWAGGRLLPEGELVKIDDYSPYRFKPNPGALPPVRDLDSDEIKKLSSIIEQRESHQDYRFSGFLTALWGMENFLSAENTVIRIKFLGRKIRIHPLINDALKRVEEEILKKAESDKDTEQWLSDLSDSGAYVWRDIAGSGNRSLHSYGIAIDLIPEDYQGKQAYWRWASDYYDDWWTIPYEDRYQVPEAVVNAFEDNGFVWGGKWFLFDQIHFEYRPELIILGRLAGNDVSIPNR